MKLAILGIVALGVIGGIVHFIPQTQVAIKERVVEVEKIVEVPTLDQRIQVAQEAAQASTTAKAQAAYDEVYTKEMQRIADKVKTDYIAEIEETIEDPEYWTSPRVERLIRRYFPEEPNTAVAVAMAESGFKMRQSYLRYTKDRPHEGVYAGQQEQSFCLFQIHAPAHENAAHELGLGDYKTNPKSCVQLARHIYESAGFSFAPWTVYTKRMYLAYVR